MSKIVEIILLAYFYLNAILGGYYASEYMKSHGRSEIKGAIFSFILMSQSDSIHGVVLVNRLSE